MEEVINSLRKMENQLLTSTFSKNKNKNKKPAIIATT